VTSDAERNQVCLGIVATLAAKSLVVHLQAGPAATTLALPAAAPVAEGDRTAWDPAEAEAVGVGLFSRSLLGDFVQKSLPLLARQKFEEA